MQATPTDRSSAAKSTYAIVATFGCIGCTFFLIAATIVLALIPIYTSTSSATINTNGRTSKETDMVIAIDDDTAPTRRRRDLTTNQTAYSGATAGNEAIVALKSKFRSYVLQHAQDISIISASIIPKTSTLTSIRRRSLSKRADLSGIALRIAYKIVFNSGCTFQCQRTKGAALKNIFEKTNFQGMTISGFIVTLSDGTKKTLNLVLGNARKIGDILPDAASGQPDVAGDDVTISPVLGATADLNG